MLYEKMFHSPDSDKTRSSSYPDISTQIDNATGSNNINIRKRRKPECDCYDEIKNMIKNLHEEYVKKNEDLIGDIKLENAKLLDSNEKLKELIVKNMSDFLDLKKKVEILEVENVSAQIKINSLESQIEEMQRNQNKYKIEIRNVPKTENEKLKDIINSMLISLKINLNPDQIKEVFRRGKDAAPIIVEFNNHAINIQLLQAIKKFNTDNRSAKLNTTHLGLQGDKLPVYVSEVLTSSTRKIFNTARELLKIGAIKYVNIIYVTAETTENALLATLKRSMHAPVVRWLGSLNDGGTLTQFFMALMVTIPVLNFGMLLGWLSPMTPILQSMDGPAPEPVTDTTLSWMAALTFFPPIFCGFHMGGLIDKWGRKNFTILTSIFLALSWTITLFSLRPWALIVSRAVAGFACATCYVVTPLYLKEIASDNVRGALGSLFILAQNLGYLLIYVCGDLMPFAAVMWLCTAVPVLHLVAFLGMPETPVFLIKQGKIKEARAALAWLRNTTVDDKNLEETIQELEREEEYTKSMTQANFKSLVQDKTRFKAFRIAVNVMLSQETCGYLVVLTYAGSIFEQASESINLKLSPNKQTIVVGAIQLIGSIVASCIVEKTGRKWLLASTSFVTGLSMLTLGLWFLVTAGGYWLPAWAPVLAMCICIFADAAGYQPVPYVIMSELFSFQYRGIATSLIISGTALSDFTQTKAYDPMLKLLGIHWVFIIFSCICFLGTFYTVMWVPETKGRTVEEIYAIIEGQKEAKDAETGKEVSRL